MQTSSSALRILDQRSIHPKFLEANVEMMAAGRLPFYGEFNLFINFIKANIATCGVNVSPEGMNFYWNQEFVDQLTQAEADFVLLHEDFHLILDHSRRSVGFDREVSNIAQDMIINQIILDEIMSSPLLRGFAEIPVDHRENIKRGDRTITNPGYEKVTALFIPKDYPGDPIFENLYTWLRERQMEHRDRTVTGKKCCPKCGKPLVKDPCSKSIPALPGPGVGGQDPGKNPGDGPGDGTNGNPGSEGDPGTCDGKCRGEGSYDSAGNPRVGPYGKGDAQCPSLDAIFDGLEEGRPMTLDVHLDDSVPGDAKKTLVEDFIRRLKNRGLVTADVERVLGKLRKSKKDYLRDIKRMVANLIFGTTKQRTITRPNRRGIEGAKGRKKHKEAVNCILDVSGSMCGDHEKVLSYVFQNDVLVNLIQVDTEVKAIDHIKSQRDFKKFSIKGGGGTVLQPAVDYLCDPKNKSTELNTLVLTDGHTDKLDFTRHRGRVLILTTSQKCPLAAELDRVKTVFIDKEQSIHGEPLKNDP